VDLPNIGYTEDEAASLLSIAPATLRFWVETFRDELDIPKDDRGGARFTEKHIEAIRRIQRLVLEDGVSLDDARASVWTAASSMLESDLQPESQAGLQPGTRPELEPKLRPGLQPQHGAPSLDANVKRDEMPLVVAQLEKTLAEVARLLDKMQQELIQYGGELAKVTDDIRYIAEENRALQELVARLVDRVDELAAPAPKATDEDIGPHPPPGRILVSSALLMQHPHIGVWRPEDLGRPAIRPSYAALSLN